MTGCHYKKHLQAPHLHSPARCNPLLAFRKMPVPPWSCSRRQPALPLLAGAAAILCHPSSPPAAGFQGTMFLSAEQEKQLFVSVLFLFCLFFVYQHTQKSSVIAKKKKHQALPSSQKDIRNTWWYSLLYYAYIAIKSPPAVWIASLKYKLNPRKHLKCSPSHSSAVNLILLTTFI